jgi:NitT/TauT family transport system substrate-binding protein
VQSGNLDIGISSPTSILIAQEGGLDLLALCASNRLVPSNPRITLVTAPGFKTDAVPDLKGDKIGIPGFYSSIEVMFCKWGADRGVPQHQMTLVEVALPQMADVLRGGGVDAVTTIEPVVSRITHTMPGTKATDYVRELSPEALGALWMSTRPWAEANRDSVKRFIAAYENAIAAIAHDPESARRIEAKYVGFVGQTFPSFSTELTANNLALYQAMMLELHLLQKPADGCARCGRGRARGAVGAPPMSALCWKICRSTRFG